MKPVTIDWSEWMKGESLADDAPTGGFSPNSYGMNLTKARGLMYFSGSSTDRGGATLTGNILASTYDKSFLGNDNYFLDDEGAFYYLDGNTLTKAQTVTADTFILGTSDLIQFQGNTYATSQTRVIQLTGSDLTGVDSSWWTGLTTSYRHPMERVEDTLYIADVNQIHTYDGTTSIAAAISLPTDVNITSLRKHPDGINLIAFCGLTANFSHTRGLGGRIYLIDTRIKRWVREIDSVPQVEGSKVSGGVVYCTYGQNFGYFDGNAIQFMKRLSTSATTYSHNMADWDGILLVRDGINVLALGDLGLGRRVWWKPLRNFTNSNSINCIAYKGSDKVLIAFASGSAGALEETDMTEAGLGGKFYGNRTIMPVECAMRRFEMLHTPVTGVYRFTVANKDETDTESTIYDTNPGSVSGVWSSKYRRELDLKSDQYQLSLSPSNGAPGFKFLRIFYDPIEQ